MFKKSYGQGGVMHSATCSGCGNECQVPFKPNGKKPVFCSACFVREEKSDERNDKSNFYEKKSAYQSRPHGRPDSRPSMNGITTEQYKTLNAKLDEILNMLRNNE